VKRLSVLKEYNAQELAMRLWDGRPQTNSTVGLDLPAQRILNCPFDPFVANSCPVFSTAPEPEIVGRLHAFGQRSASRRDHACRQETSLAPSTPTKFRF
jgi:hypothetical protein